MNIFKNETDVFNNPAAGDMFDIIREMDHLGIYPEYTASKIAQHGIHNLISWLDVIQHKNNVTVHELDGNEHKFINSKNGKILRELLPDYAWDLTMPGDNEIQYVSSSFSYMNIAGILFHFIKRYDEKNNHVEYIAVINKSNNETAIKHYTDYGNSEVINENMPGLVRNFLLSILAENWPCQM